MEIVQKYWWAILAGLALVFFMSRQNSGAGSIQQIGGGSGDTLALAQLASTERDADENRRYGLLSTVLNYQLADKNLNQQIDLAKISANAQTEAMRNNYLLASLQANVQNQQYAQQLGLQQYALESAYNQQRRNDWLGAISSGIQSVAPFFFGTSTTQRGGFGGFGGTPPFVPSGGLTWRDLI